MRSLLDTNIVIHREASKVVNPDIGTLFYWLDKLHYSKCVHPVTLQELKKHIDGSTVQTMTIKLGNYNLLQTEAPLNDAVKAVSASIDTTENDLNDTKLLNELYVGRVDLLISEDKKIHKKAESLGISHRVFRIDSFLEKVTRENPSLVDYKVLSVQKKYFGNIDINDNFFDSFKEDYNDFEKWYAKKSDEIAYVCYVSDKLAAFLYLKVENESENYSDITPTFQKKKRLKIGTFKVSNNGYKLGERFLKLIFDNARQYKVDEIYLTIYDKRPEQKRLIELIEEWGFINFGEKNSSSGNEKVYVRDYKKTSDPDNPKRTFPRLSRINRVFIVPIYPEYHTELFPDSILRTESPLNFVELEPHRNALSKVYVSHSRERNINRGDVILFYRTGGIYKGVATTIGIVDNVYKDIKDLDELLYLCKKRTVLTDEELKKFWERYPGYKPFVVNFLYAFSFKKRPNLKHLLELGIISDVNSVPRGFSEITWDHLISLIEKFGI